MLRFQPAGTPALRKAFPHFHLKSFSQMTPTQIADWMISPPIISKE